MQAGGSSGAARSTNRGREGVRDAAAIIVAQRAKSQPRRSGPKDHDAFAGVARDRQTEIDALLATGPELVEVAERLVCRLYGIASDLEDEVVAHAVARAAR